MSDKRKIILDVDTGSDDAIAIAVALLSPELEVVGITTVNGNQPVLNTTENTLRVVDLLGSKVPVIKGCAIPMVTTLNPRRQVTRTSLHVTGDDGHEVGYHAEFLDCLDPSVSKPLDDYAVNWLVNTLMSSDEKITLVPVGPLTNIGMALRVEPKIVEHIEEIVIMGGGHEQRNYHGGAEFNIWVDPEAAQIVFECGAPITLMPLDATHQSYLDNNDSDYFKGLKTKVGDFVAEQIDERIEAYNLLQPLHTPDIAPIHDALCVAYLLSPSVVTTVDSRVDVDCSGGICDGRTICDMRTYRFKPNNVKLCIDADTEKFAAMMREILTRANV